MCHYDQIVWFCHFWRWDKFRQRCPAETRTGETCGMKLVFETKYRDTPCPLCINIAKKQRRCDKMKRDIERWVQEKRVPETVKRTFGEYCTVYAEWVAMVMEHRHKTHPGMPMILIPPLGLEDVPAPATLGIEDVAERRAVSQ